MAFVGPVWRGMWVPASVMEYNALMRPGICSSMRAVSGQRAQFASARKPYPQKKNDRHLSSIAIFLWSDESSRTDGTDMRLRNKFCASSRITDQLSVRWAAQGKSLLGKI